jgi:RNA polymerase sigma factor (sigma-70 family)
MQPTDDSALLRQYAEDHSDEAFAALVTRHINLVYSVALRHVGDPHQAEEVTQAVFVILAKKPLQLRHDKALSSWLFQSTRLTASNYVRGETRRHRHEQEAHMQSVLSESGGDVWPRIAPLLDDAVAGLSEKDRHAIVLRFYEGRNLRELGAALGTSEDAAQKRISRAVERLREFFAKRGVATSGTALGVALSAHAIQAAPAGLAATISTAATVAGTAAIHTSTAIAATKAIAMTTLQKTLVTAAFIAAVGTGIYEARQAARLRGKVQTLQQQQTPLTKQIQELQHERDVATRWFSTLADEIGKIKNNSSELLRLRGELTRLRTEDRESLTARIAHLKQKLEQISDKKIPELQFLTERDWANAAWDADLNTEDGVREALSKLREGAINTFLNEMMKAAFKKYLAAHDGILPADLFQLKPYFNVPVTDAMLQRYELLQSGKPDNHADLVKLVAFADEEYDSNHGMSINGAWGSRFNRVGDVVKAAAREFANDNNGQMPVDPSQIAAYIKKPIDPVTIQKYLKEIAADPPRPEVVTFAPSLKAFAEANNGKPPENPLDLLPYLATPEQQAAFLKLEQMPPEVTALVPALKVYAGAHNGRLPKNSADLLPYLTTPEQQAALQKLEQTKKPASR